MDRCLSSPLFAALLLAGISCAHASEEWRPELLQQIESLQRRADRMAIGKPGADNYHLAKARTWLDLALSEYHEKDDNGIISFSVEQAQTLLDALDGGKSSTDPATITMDTPMQVRGSEAVRPDLWEKIAALKKHQNFSCGQRPVAEAEVMLVWTGHEKLESSWGHAEQYALRAKELIGEAKASIDGCAAKMPIIEKIALSSDALFEFASADLEPSALWQLNSLADNIKTAKALQEVALVGHTDRLRSDGKHERNQLLSEQRAERIKQYLIGKGIPADKIHASGAGSTQPLVQCPANRSKAKQVKCLKPNRRVEIILRGTR